MPIPFLTKSVCFMKALPLLLMATGLLAACQTANEKQIGLNEPIRHDDFLYSVRRAVVQDSIGSLKPRGRFWIVTFQVENQAVRVGHQWTNATAFVADANGRVYENSPTAQQRLNQVNSFNWQDKYLTPARRTDSTRLVFDLPTSVRQPYLQVRGEVLMGDVFDGRQFERTRVRLF